MLECGLLDRRVRASLTRHQSTYWGKNKNRKQSKMFLNEVEKMMRTPIGQPFTSRHRIAGGQKPIVEKLCATQSVFLVNLFRLLLLRSVCDFCQRSRPPIPRLFVLGLNCVYWSRPSFPSTGVRARRAALRLANAHDTTHTHTLAVGWRLAISFPSIRRSPGVE